MPDTLVELWQANTAGKYNHPADEFAGAGRPALLGLRALRRPTPRAATRFTTIKPGAYPVQRTGNWWRPPHIHFSLFGPTFLTRLVTQMYFPGDPLNEIDHILAGVSDPAARERLMAAPAPEVGIWETRARLALRHRAARPPRHAARGLTMATAWQTLGPFFDRKLIRHGHDLTRAGPGRPQGAGDRGRGAGAAGRRRAGRRAACSRSGRPMPPAATPIRRIAASGRSTPTSWASGAR